MSLSNEDIAHLAGVFDAIGIVNIRIAKDDTYRIGYEMRPICEVTQTEGPMQDALMEKMCAYCDENNVKYMMVHANKREGENDRNKLTITEPWAIEEFLEPLLPYLVANYEPAVLMIEAAVPLLKHDRHLDKQGFYDLMGIADQLRSSRNNKRSVYDQQYFAEEWDSVA